VTGGTKISQAIAEDKVRRKRSFCALRDKSERPRTAFGFGTELTAKFATMHPAAQVK